MKTLKKFIAIIAFLGFFACQEDPIEPKGILTDEGSANLESEAVTSEEGDVAENQKDAEE